MLLDSQAHQPTNTVCSEEMQQRGRRTGLVVNADDWGRDKRTTDAIRNCVDCGSVGATSAMVFMEDSERAAEVAGECGVDVGLHLNLTTTFSIPNCASRLLEHQEKTATYLRRTRLGPMIYSRHLSSSFDYLVQAQLDEFRRLYGKNARRIDGHHHMHLCANVLCANLLPSTTQVRRNFSFRRGEKSLPNRLYRQFIDGRLAKRHRLTDYFFSIQPLTAARLQHFCSTARESLVELETHPVNSEEYRFLTQGEIQRQAGDVLLESGFAGIWR